MKTIQDKVSEVNEFFGNAEMTPKERDELAALLRSLFADAADPLGLEEYVGCNVLAYLKQPYQFYMARVEGDKPMVMLLKEQNGRLVPAGPGEANAQPLPIFFLQGILRQRATGHYYVEVADAADPAKKLEVAYLPELVMFVVKVTETPKTRLVLVGA